jgi:hypothetical protein
MYFSSNGGERLPRGCAKTYDLITRGITDFQFDDPYIPGAYSREKVDRYFQNYSTFWSKIPEGW